MNARERRRILVLKKKSLDNRFSCDMLTILRGLYTHLWVGSASGDQLLDGYLGNRNFPKAKSVCRQISSCQYIDRAVNFVS